ncbi:cupin domain-containing protein [Lichenihabitans sp. Uapishka_5]|uniref:helix-turn-helix domain-containing protein n=1 Tax=Lichenihabitans sp. Uapishka_5 TaxID=3037302 RepID=UPI0029E7D292|nr:cupin domain-containing protein [Lichenihabitans sp. Uapishka_5]MDX7953830.1 cupin domain-containing protein [Lichenihabitans sp. Uapishka_5]
MSDVAVEGSAADVEGGSAADPTDLRIGRRIRALRLRRGRSLAELALSTGISIGGLSQIERGLTSLKVKTLWPLAGALGIEPQALLDDAGTLACDLHVVRRDERRGVPVWSEGIGKELLSPSGAALTGLSVRVEPGGGTAAAYAHPGQEFGLVLAGEVDLEIDGVTSRLQAGDSFAFKSTLPHAFRNPGAVPCEIVWVNTVKPLDVRNGA